DAVGECRESVGGSGELDDRVWLRLRHDVGGARVGGAGERDEHGVGGVERFDGGAAGGWGEGGVEVEWGAERGGGGGDSGGVVDASMVGLGWQRGETVGGVDRVERSRCGVCDPGGEGGFECWGEVGGEDAVVGSYRVHDDIDGGGGEPLGRRAVGED